MVGLGGLRRFDRAGRAAILVRSDDGATGMGIWKRAVPSEIFAEKHAATLPGLLGIRLVEVGEDFVRATMPVDERHIQPAGILHGGASVVLAETIGSFCGVMALEEGWTVVGAGGECQPPGRGLQGRHGGGGLPAAAARAAACRSGRSRSGAATDG